MLEVAGPLAVAALVLTAGGAFKLRDPAPTREMLTSLGLPGRRGPRPGRRSMVAMAMGLAELAIGSATFLLGGRVLCALTGGLFAGFALLTWRLVRMPSAGSCGCFGRHSSETTWLHVVVNISVAGVAWVAAVVDAPGFLDARAELPAAGIPFLALAALGAWFLVAALTVLPAAVTAARRGPGASAVPTFEIRSST